MIAVREAGPNPDSNFRLRLTIQKARDSNMPSENIERAIKKGSGALEGASLNEILVEGYGPAGVAVMVQALTDNRNRTLQEVRNLFSRHGGNMGESGCVSWIFDNRGVITVDTSGGVDVEALALTAIDAGADDVRMEKDFLEVITTPQNLEPVRKAIEAVKPVISAEVSRVPKTTVVLGEKEALQTLKLLDHLEEMDDVQHVFANVDYSEAVLEKLRTMA
jgi:YebC/PmpR family DNA-binding regulatory protein